MKHQPQLQFMKNKKRKTQKLAMKNNIKKELSKDLEKETKKRLIRLDKEMKSGEDFKLTMFENKEGYDQMIIMKDMRAVAKCEHHHCEFTCIIHAGYISNGWLIGASKFNRITRKYLHLKKETLQERATQQILNELMKIKPLGAIVTIQGKHSCIAYRGVREDSTMITSAVGGVFKTDPSAKAEFISLTK